MVTYAGGCWAFPNDRGWRCIDFHPDFPHTWCDAHAAEVRAATDSATVAGSSTESENPNMSVLYVPDEMRAEIDNWREEPDASDGADLLMAILVANDNSDVDYGIRLRRMADRIDAFSAECEAESYTDTGDAWELLNAARDLAREVTPWTVRA